MSASDEQMLVVRSIRQSFENNASGGSAVQANPNPFFITVNGSFDLLRAATAVIQNLDLHRNRVAVQAQEAKEAHLKKAAEELRLAALDPEGA